MMRIVRLGALVAMLAAVLALSWYYGLDKFAVVSVEREFVIEEALSLHGKLQLVDQIEGAPRVVLRSGQSLVMFDFGRVESSPQVICDVSSSSMPLVRSVLNAQVDQLGKLPLIVSIVGENLQVLDANGTIERSITLDTIRGVLPGIESWGYLVQAGCGGTVVCSFRLEHDYALVRLLSDGLDSQVVRVPSDRRVAVSGDDGRYWSVEAVPGNLVEVRVGTWDGEEMVLGSYSAISRPRLQASVAQGLLLLSSGLDKYPGLIRLIDGTGRERCASSRGSLATLGDREVYFVSESGALCSWSLDDDSVTTLIEIGGVAPLSDASYVCPPVCSPDGRWVMWNWARAGRRAPSFGTILCDLRSRLCVVREGLWASESCFFIN